MCSGHIEPAFYYPGYARYIYRPSTDFQVRYLEARWNSCPLHHHQLSIRKHRPAIFHLCGPAKDHLVKPFRQFSIDTPLTIIYRTFALLEWTRRALTHTEMMDLVDESWVHVDDSLKINQWSQCVATVVQSAVVCLGGLYKGQVDLCASRRDGSPGFRSKSSELRELGILLKISNRSFLETRELMDGQLDETQTVAMRYTHSKLRAQVANRSTIPMQARHRATTLVYQFCMAGREL